jgi:hypothetical protein
MATRSAPGVPSGPVEAEVDGLGVLRQVSRTRCDELHFAVYFDARADRIAVGFDASQTERDRLALRTAIVLEDADLRTQPALDQ